MHHYCSLRFHFLYETRKSFSNFRDWNKNGKGHGNCSEVKQKTISFFPPLVELCPDIITSFFISNQESVSCLSTPLILFFIWHLILFVHFFNLFRILDIQQFLELLGDCNVLHGMSISWTMSTFIVICVSFWRACLVFTTKVVVT